jgi:NTE family protein
MVNLLTEQNVTRSLTLLRPGVDIYIRPELEGLTAGDFERSDDAIARGYAAATALENQLRALARSEDDYALWQRRSGRQARAALLIDAVQTQGLEPARAQALTAQMRTQPGSALDVQTLEEDLLHAYGEGRYSNVAYQLDRTSDQNTLTLFATEKPWGPDFVRAGVNFAWGSGDEARYNIRAAYQRTQLNAQGGEWLLIGQFGADTQVGSDWYQPLDLASPWFVQAQGLAGSHAVDLYNKGKAQARFKIDYNELNGGLGVNLGRYGVLKSGLLLRKQSATTTVGSDSLLPANNASNTSAWYALADLDRFDSPYFPSAGWRARLLQTQTSDYTKLDGSYAQAFSWSGNVLTGRIGFTRAVEGTLPLSDSAWLGGVNNLSGLAYKQILGSDMRYAGLRVERIVGRTPLGLRGDLRVGLSLEGGSMQERYSETQGSGIVRSSGLYLGGETPIGPLYLGIAQASDNDARLFLFIGNP